MTSTMTFLSKGLHWLVDLLLDPALHFVVVVFCLGFWVGNAQASPAPAVTDSIQVGIYVPVLASEVAERSVIVAFFTHSFVDGQTETCFYRSPLGTHAITINRAQICPLTIRV